MTKPNYEELLYSDFINLSLATPILIVTATNTETKGLHSVLTPITGHKSLLKIYKNSLTLFFGKLGLYNIIHVQCGMGSISRDSSLSTVKDSIALLKPKLVFMVGIAFGLDSAKQKIGDVLVAESVLPYDSKRVGKDTTIHRGISIPSSKILLSRVKSMSTWEHIGDDGIVSEIIIGGVLSGEELIDNELRRNELLGYFPNAKGGEMEGAGLSSACDGIADWLLIKGICDFADGNKSESKVNNQSTAIKAAVSLLNELLASRTIFADFGVYALDEAKKDTIGLAGHDLNLILFDIYTKRVREHYIERDVDSAFSTYFPFFSQWIYGESGFGKSTLIFRNLINTQKEYVYISLANCVGSKIDSLFNEILTELYTLNNVNYRSSRLPITKVLKCILAALKELYTNKQIVVFIEEIPISSDKDYTDFVDKFFSLAIMKESVPELSGVKFILSSIGCPKNHIKNFNAKVAQYIKFIELTPWSNKEIKLLIEKINLSLNINLGEDPLDTLITLANGSPRVIKEFYREFTILNPSFDIESLTNHIYSTTNG